MDGVAMFSYISENKHLCEWLNLWLEVWNVWIKFLKKGMKFLYLRLLRDSDGTVDVAELSIHVAAPWVHLQHRRDEIRGEHALTYK